MITWGDIGWTVVIAMVIALSVWFLVTHPDVRLTCILVGKVPVCSQVESR